MEGEVMDELEETQRDENLVYENEISEISVEYRCEVCNYRWVEKEKPYLTTIRSTSNRLMIDDSNVRCPMCGSTQVTRV